MKKNTQNFSELIDKLNRIEEAINTKGHPMQDYSSLKIAMLDLISVLKIAFKDIGEKDA